MKRKGDRREAASEGSVERQSRPDAQKPDEGRVERTSGPMTAKSISIKRRHCRFGGGATKAIELTSGGLPCVRDGCELKASMNPD